MKINPFDHDGLYAPRARELSTKIRDVLKGATFQDATNALRHVSVILEAEEQETLQTATFVGSGLEERLTRFDDTPGPVSTWG